MVLLDGAAASAVSLVVGPSNGPGEFGSLTLEAPLLQVSDQDQSISVTVVRNAGQYEAVAVGFFVANPPSSADACWKCAWKCSGGDWQHDRALSWGLPAQLCKHSVMRGGGICTNTNDM